MKPFEERSLGWMNLKGKENKEDLSLSRHSCLERVRSVKIDVDSRRVRTCSPTFVNTCTCFIIGKPADSFIHCLCCKMLENTVKNAGQDISNSNFTC